MLLTALGQTGLQIPVTPQLVAIFFLLLLAMWAAFTWVIHYHWRKYGVGAVSTWTTLFVYHIGAITLIGITATFVFSYYASS